MELRMKKRKKGKTLFLHFLAAVFEKIETVLFSKRIGFEPQMFVKNCLISQNRDGWPTFKFHMGQDTVDVYRERYHLCTSPMLSAPVSTTCFSFISQHASTALSNKVQGRLLGLLILIVS